MTIAFITSLRHPLNSTDYEHVEALLANTLASVANQIDRDFRIIVVGNQAPRLRIPSQCEFVKVDFPPPINTAGPRSPRDVFIRDKGSKIGIGLVAAERHKPTDVMIFDADDFISCRISKFVNNQPTPPGTVWVIRNGWRYSPERGVISRQREFNRVCGTSLIVPYKAYGVPEHLSVRSSQNDVVTAFGDTLTRTLGAHRDAVEWFEARGLAIRTLPFAAAVYQVDTGENHSGNSLAGLARPLTTSVVREFQVPIQSSLTRSIVSAWGPMAGAISARRYVRSRWRR